MLNWPANYMDSKFGPDGALYVQVYQGFFSTGPDAGLYRFKYTGGPDTPNPDPQWRSTATARQIQFSLGSSGGVSYSWNFGDGTPTSTDANPAHTYAATGTYDATLTVTYADGERLSKTTTVTVTADAAAPTTVVQINGTTPATRYTAAGRGHAARDRRHRRHRRRVDRVPDRRRRLDAPREHRAGRPVRDHVQRGDGGPAHGRVPLA